MELDGDQMAYGPGNRLYECSDGRRLALVIPTSEARARVANLPDHSAAIAGCVRRSSATRLRHCSTFRSLIRR
jgi:hypothetical protein